MCIDIKDNAILASISGRITDNNIFTTIPDIINIIDTLFVKYIIIGNIAIFADMLNEIDFLIKFSTFILHFLGKIPTK